MTVHMNVCRPLERPSVHAVRLAKLAKVSGVIQCVCQADRMASEWRGTGDEQWTTPLLILLKLYWSCKDAQLNREDSLLTQTADHTLIVQKVSKALVGVAIETGHPVMKSIRRHIRRAFKEAE